MAVANITTSAGRARLAPRREPYFVRVGKGQHLGFRRIEIGGSWVAKLTQDKTRQHSALGSEADYPEYQDALQAALKWFGTMATEDHHTPGYTVQHAIDDYVRDLRQRKGADTATRNEQAARKHITPSLGPIPLAKLSTKTLRRWQLDLIATSNDAEKVRKSQDTANRTYTVLRSALNSAFRDGAVQSDAAWRRVRPFPNVTRAREVFLTADQCKRLMASCKPDLRPLVKSALLIGGRFGELARRKLNDLDLSRGVLHIPDGKTGSRNVVLSDAAIAHFRELARDKLPGAYLHAKANGDPWDRNDQGYAMRRAVDAVNLSATGPADRFPSGTCFYTLRHTHISMALLAGVQAQILAENCGTSVAMIEKHYAKFLHSDRRAQFNLVSVL